MMEYLVLGLIAYCVVREFFFMYTVNKLVDKVMSRSYYDYKVSTEVGKQKPEQKFQLPPDDAEDLGILNSFTQ